MKDIKDLTPKQLIVKTKKKTHQHWYDIYHKSIIDAVIRNEGNRNAAAREIGVKRQTVYRHWNEYLLSKPL